MLIKVLSAAVVALTSCLIYVVFKPLSVKLNISSVNDMVRNDADSKLSSSVWCYYDKTQNKICTFTNLYYLPEYKSFIFSFTNSSVISGLPSKTDLRSINLSSVQKHNDMYMKLQIVINFHLYLNHDNIVFVHEPVLLIRRFKPDNIMHVIHDDIMPIFMTFSHLCAGNIEECVYNNRLMFTDNSDDYKYLEWYKLFSHKKPFNLKNLKTLSCFDKINVGLSRETVWFQYGFGMPQGPVESATVNSLIVNRFNNFVLSGFNIKRTALPLNNEEFINIVLLSRKINRKILNENFVVNKISETYRSVYPEHNKIIKIHILDPSQNKSSDILDVVARSHVLVGMHGSAMIYSLFLPENAAIIELFPFGIQPQHVSSTRALCQLPGIFYNYLSWRNFKESNSILHPERSALLGGIKHLSDAQKDVIEKLKTVPAVECCHDPAYLYRIFQDTIVDDSFKIIFKQVLINQKEAFQEGIESNFNEYLKSNWFFPGPISRISCGVDKSIGKILIEWNEPYNVHVNHVLKMSESVLYHVTVKVFNRIINFETFSTEAGIKLTSEEINSVTQTDSVQIWIKVVVGNIEGTDVHSRCLLVNQ